MIGAMSPLGRVSGFSYMSILVLPLDTADCVKSQAGLFVAVTLAGGIGGSSEIIV
jgi:hypothetical protein